MTAPPVNATRLAPLRVEGHQPEESGRQGGHDGPTYRPHGVYLQNDGRWHHWMTPDETYRLTRDDQGWVVTCRTWPSDGHVYRLARDGQHTDVLLWEGNLPYTLDAAAVYEIRHWPGSGWALYRVDA